MKCYYEDVDCKASKDLTPTAKANWCVPCQLAKLRKVQEKRLERLDEVLERGL